MSAKSGCPWGDRNFGPDAPDLRQAVVQALTDACVHSRDAQDVSGARTLDPFGHTLKTLQFQELADQIEALLPDRHRIEKLDRYSLAVVNNFILYPVRSVNGKSAKAKDGSVRKPVSKLRRRMFTALGPAPYQPSLTSEWADEAAEDLRTLIARLGKGTRLAAISYVCSFDTGLSDVYWGEAELNVRDGSLIFHDGESLSVVPALGGVRRGLPTVADASDGVGSRAFDGGAPPEFDLAANPSHQTPITESEPPQPLSIDDEG